MRVHPERHLPPSTRRPRHRPGRHRYLVAHTAHLEQHGPVRLFLHHHARQSSDHDLHSISTRSGRKQGFRSTGLCADLLQAMVRHQARCAILDVTGVADIGERMAAFLEQIVQCVELLGGVCFITGMQPAVAQKLIHGQVNLSAFRAFADLEGGLRAAFGRLGLGVRALP